MWLPGWAQGQDVHSARLLVVLHSGCGRVSWGVSATPWVLGESQGQVHLGQTGTLALRMSGVRQLPVSSSTSWRHRSSFLR